MFITIATMSARVYLWLLIFLVAPKDATATNGTLGSLFVLALPRLTFQDNANQSNITFNVATFSETPFEVTFQFVYNTEPDRDKQTKVISRGNFSTFVVNKTLWDERDLVRKGVFKVNGNGRFGLTVLMFGSKRDMSTFTAVPVEAWGTEYYAVTLGNNPSIQIISAEQNRIEILYYLLYGPNMHNFTFDDSVYRGHSKTQTFTLNSYEAVSISHCDDTFLIFGTYTGTQISGEVSFGVVSGSCTSFTLTRACSDKPGEQWGITSDPVTEMMVPAGHWGTEFIVMTIPARRLQGCARIINAKRQNRVNLTHPDPTSIYRSLLFLNQGFWDLAIPNSNIRVYSNLPIQVVYLQTSACLDGKNLKLIGEPFGDPSICILTPNDLFFILYVWHLPETPTINYAALISEKENCPSITLDDNPLPSRFLWQDVLETPKYAVNHLQLSSGYHEVGSSSFKKFGCYFYGIAKEVSFMHPGGYQACDSTFDPTDGDLIDNDCDGSIDEEERDYSDDDDDGLIDEDTRKSPKVDGHWGEWEEWFCNPDCAHRQFVRVRYCNNPPAKGYGKPCAGDVAEFRHVSCKPEKILYCPDELPGSHHDVQPKHRVCGFKRWGPNCTSFCTHCFNDCDEHTGACTQCLRGYKNPAAGCGKVCDANEYGFDCAGSCFEKCGVDCVEREFGKCSITQMHLLILLGAVLIVCIFLISFCCISSRKSRMEHYVNGRSSTGGMMLEETINDQVVEETYLKDTDALSEENKSQAGSIARSIYSTKSNVTNPSVIGSNVDP